MAVDESQLDQINTQLSGTYACPIEGCGKDIDFPNAEEAAELKAPTDSAPPEPAGEELAIDPATESAPSSGSAPPHAQIKASPPAPPPQTNPAAKSAQPPSGVPPPPAPESTTPLQRSAFEYAVDRREAKLDRGFHGSKGETLEREAATSQRISVKTILHGDCWKDKKDTFDETVAQFLNELDEECLMSVQPVQYTVDEKKGADFGVMILYKIMVDED